MANRVPFIRLVLNEKLRKHLGINVLTKNKKIYIFKVKGKTYLSSDMIPKTAEYHIVKTRLGAYRWYINIPITYLDYMPSSFQVINTIGTVVELIK